jgi:hypothetical protein
MTLAGPGTLRKDNAHGPLERWLAFGGRADRANELAALTFSM